MKKNQEEEKVFTLKDLDESKTNGYQVAEVVKNGIIDKDETLDFDVDKYFLSIVNRKSEAEEK